MKNLALTIWAICLTGILSAQLPVKNEIIIDKRIKQIKEDNGLDNNTITYNFSTTGKIKDKIIETKAGVINRKTEYYYSKDSLIQNTKIFLLISHTSGLKYSGKDEYFYDANNNLIKINGYSWGLMQPNNMIENKSIYEYDSKSNLVNKTEYKYHSNGTVSSTTKYQYAYKDGRLYERKKYYNDNYRSKETYEYDEKGNLIKAMYYSSDGQPREKITYQYNSEGLLIEKSIYDLTWKHSSVIKYSYTFLK